MALDWCKVQKSTPRKPEVLRLASILKITPDHAFGLCFRFWSWCDDQLSDGNARGVTGEMVDSLLSFDGFANSLVEVGWLQVRNGSLEVPNFDRHLSESAKNRAISAERTRKHRDKDVTDDPKICNGESVTKVLPEKRREEKRREDSTSESSQKSSSQRPIKPIGDRNRSLKRFSLWKDAKTEDFQEAKRVQEVFIRLKESGGCTDDERFHVFRFVAHMVRTLDKPTDNVPGCVVSCLRGDAAGASPWRSRGDDDDANRAREQMRAIDVPAEMRIRTGNLDDINVDVRREDQKARLLARKGNKA